MVCKLNIELDSNGRLDENIIRVLDYFEDMYSEKFTKQQMDEMGYDNFMKKLIAHIHDETRGLIKIGDGLAYIEFANEEDMTLFKLEWL